MRSIAPQDVAAAMACISGLGADMPAPIAESQRPWKRIDGRIVGVYANGCGRRQPRNAACYCGSGQKAKRCHEFFPDPEKPQKGAADAAATS